MTVTSGQPFALRSGEVAYELSGAETGRLVIGIPGLTANLRSFDVIYEGLDGERHRKLAFDPRGRGRSSKTAPGTYGWPSHARDVIEMADQLHAQTFDVIGWSMGAWIAMVVAQMAPGRVRRLVLIDAVGIPEESAKVPVYAGLERLATVFPSREAFMALARTMPHYQPWAPWERLFDYELIDVEGGVSFRTQKAAPFEDEQYRLQQDPYKLWSAVTMPVLLLRAAREIPPNFGYILTKEDYDRFLREVPGATGLEVDANHYTIGMNADAAQAIAEFLDR
ncbi:MAG TPA: alpha/beta hydrolase [Candidatus Dormibacteraeota bacterium]|nr:alpha/beta hydrolase [Candidatus Dormibacteraeota bacterium]